MKPGKPDPLLATYLERRGELLGYFTVRLRSTTAAEDLVQEIYLRIASRHPEPIDNPPAYLFRLGTNLMLDQMKSERRMARRASEWKVVHGSETGESVADAPAADDALIARQRLQQIITALSGLPENARKAFRLHKLEGLSHSETAAAMGVSRSSVEKYLMACLKRIATEVDP